MHRRLLAIGTISAVLAIATGCGVAPTPSSMVSPEASAQQSTGPGVASSSPLPTASIGRARWEPAGMMTADHPSIHAHPLPDGRVLILGEDSTTELWDPESRTWRGTTGLAQVRTRFASVLLADGRIFVVGGLNDIEQSYSSAYLFDPASESWEKVAGLMQVARTNPSAALLPDGRVLIAGGYFHVALTSRSLPVGNQLASYRRPTGSDQPRLGWPDIVPGPFGAALATAEIFDPATGQFSSAGAMRYARNGAAVATLRDGRILIVGSKASSLTGVEVAPDAETTAEIYDAATRRFTRAGEFPATDLSAAAEAGINASGIGYTNEIGALAPLSDGGALLIARTEGFKHFGVLVRSLRYDVASGRWQEFGDPAIYLEDPVSGATYQTPNAPLTRPAVAALANGTILVAGGQPWLGRPGATVATANVYDPQTGSWIPLPDMPGARAGAAVTVLRDGSVMLIGGDLWAGDSPGPLTSVVQLRLND
jgi:hypothetical protein